MQNPVTEPVEAYVWKPEPLYRRVTVVARPDIIPKPITKQKVKVLGIGVFGVSLTPSRSRIGLSVSRTIFSGRLGSTATSLRLL